MIISKFFKIKIKSEKNEFLCIIDKPTKIKNLNCPHIIFLTIYTIFYKNKTLISLFLNIIN
jgi:hypothetical protein